MTTQGTQLGRTVAGVTRKTTIWYFVLAPLTLFYLAVAFKAAMSLRPISGLLGLPANHLYVIVVDMGVLSSPLIAGIFIYVNRLGRRQKHAREAFMREFENRDLVVSKYNSRLIYVVLDKGAGGATLKLHPVWTADGRCFDGATYDGVDAASVTAFDATRFIAG